MERMRLRVGVGVWLLIAGTTAVPSDAELIADRIASFREIGTAFKNLNDELRGKEPNFTLIHESAGIIKKRGADMPHWFPPGTEPPPSAEKSWLDTLLAWFDVGEDSLAFPDEVTTNARIEVWTKPNEFKEAHQRFLSEAEKLWQVVEDRDKAAIAAQVRALGQACDSCHEIFRKD